MKINRDVLIATLLVGVAIFFYMLSLPKSIDKTQVKQNKIVKEVKKRSKIQIKKQKQKYLYNFTLNKISSYYLDFNQTSKVPVGSQTSTIHSEISSFVHLKPLKIDANRIYLYVQLSNIKLKLPLPNSVKNMIKKVYKTLFLMKMNKEGRILEITVPFDKASSAGLKEIFYLLESINKAYKYYEVVESDISGKYKASYTKNGYILNKTRDKYVAYNNKMQTIDILDSKSTITIDDKGDWVKKIVLYEKTKSKAKKGRSVQNINSILFKKVNTNVNSLDIFKEKRGYDKIYKSFISKRKNTNLWQKAQRQNLISQINKAHVSINDVLTRLQKDPKQINNYRMLLQYLRAKPSSAKTIAKEFGNYSDEVQKQVISAMSSANNKESENALISIAKNSSYGKVNQMRAIVGLNLMEKPSQNSLEALNDITSSQDRDVSNSALLAYGTVTGKIGSQDGVEELKQKYADSKTAAQKRTVILAMQNAGSAQFIDELEKESRSSSKKIRELAVRALAKIKDPKLREKVLKEQLKIQKDDKLHNLISYYLKNIRK